MATVVGAKRAAVLADASGALAERRKLAALGLIS
jgi:hypothetical protein